MSRYHWMAVATSVGALAALGLAPTASAGGVPVWDGPYEITFRVDEKTGTSMAATQAENRYTDSYTFDTSCSGGSCVATIVGGPAPRNSTVPVPVTFTWNGSAWASNTNFHWNCLMPDGSIEWNPASAQVAYTPQSDDTFAGRWHTDIQSGACQGTVDITMAAIPA
ncbi:MAG: hypothetical protein K0U76_17215 [Actinomycetia bacterium]|nr:hypothetical protein [Actinomycetes bacterium]MCH9703089.1 hypothetical protein [Actinomycetes bacterium]MCH9760451.1 hypothetical protein [Actinomycetes bacterium]